MRESSRFCLYVRESPREVDCFDDVGGRVDCFENSSFVNKAHLLHFSSKVLSFSVKFKHGFQTIYFNIYLDFFVALKLTVLY